MRSVFPTLPLLLTALAVAQTQPSTTAARGRAARPNPNAPPQPAADSLRKDWIDPDTGHRIFRLSTENGSGSLYFHYNAYSADGKYVIFNSPSGIMAANLDTHQAQLIAPGIRAAMETSRIANEVYYVAPYTSGPNTGPQLYIWAADLLTKKTRLITSGETDRVTCVNCDGTLFAGVLNEVVDAQNVALKPDSIPAADQFARMFPGKTQAQLTPEQIASATKENRLAAQLKRAVTAPDPHCIFTLKAKGGEVNFFGLAYAWLNHLQFSPTDPNMLMFCHEGTWHEVDRVWTINLADKNSTPKLMHKRTMDMEIAGHEWWAPDGKSVWFDLQTPRSVDFWIAGVNLATGKETRYHLERNWWGIHFAMSHDQKMFASDGGDPGQVAFAKDGQWINLLRIQPDGTLTREKLVNMAKHNYVTAASGGINGVEPNVTFSPDDKYILFTGTFDGAKHVYAVEINKSSEL